MIDFDVREKVARAIRLADAGDSLPPGFAERMWDEGIANRDRELRLADGVLAAIRPVIEQAKAETWDEGYGDGLRKHFEGDDVKFSNPYKKEER